MANNTNTPLTGYNKLVHFFSIGRPENEVIAAMIAYGWSYKEAQYALKQWAKFPPKLVG